LQLGVESGRSGAFDGRRLSASRFGAGDFSIGSIGLAVGEEGLENTAPKFLEFFLTLDFTLDA
jgi:hypothetical protein